MKTAARSTLKALLFISLTSSVALAEWVPLGNAFGGPGSSTGHDARIPNPANYTTCDYELRVAANSSAYLPYINSYGYTRLPFNSFNRSSDVRYVNNVPTPGYTASDNNIFLDYKFDIPNTALDEVSAAVTPSNGKTLSDLKRDYGGTLTCRALITWYRPTLGQSWIARQNVHCDIPTRYNTDGRITTVGFYGKFLNNSVRLFQNCK